MSKIVEFYELKNYRGKYIYLHNKEDGKKGRFIVDSTILKKDITDPKFPENWRDTIPIGEISSWISGWYSKNLQFEIGIITDVSHIDIDP